VATNQNERLESRRLANLLRAEIEAGAKYPPGTKLPSYRQLVAKHGVARNTVGAALRLLEAEGLVDIRPASGVYARDPSAPPSTRDVRAELKDLREQLQRTKHELANAQKTVAGLLEYLPAEEPP
jgi:DNA-binding FadR family transcriptional regulator